MASSCYVLISPLILKHLRTYLEIKNEKINKENSLKCFNMFIFPYSGETSSRASIHLDKDDVATGVFTAGGEEFFMEVSIFLNMRGSRGGLGVSPQWKISKLEVSLTILVWIP